MKGLIIDEPWVSLLVSGEKTWEMRSRNTQVRGCIALIKKGSKMVIGLADLVDTLLKLPRSELRASFAKHRVPENEIDEDFKWSTAWVRVLRYHRSDNADYDKRCDKDCACC